VTIVKQSIIAGETPHFPWSRQGEATGSFKAEFSLEILILQRLSRPMMGKYKVKLFCIASFVAESAEQDANHIPKKRLTIETLRGSHDKGTHYFINNLSFFAAESDGVSVIQPSEDPLLPTAREQGCSGSLNIGKVPIQCPLCQKTLIGKYVLILTTHE